VRAFVRQADSWIAYGSPAANEIVQLGADPQRTVIAPNAVPKPARSQLRGRPHDPLRFLSVGQLIQRKGLDLLLEAFRNRKGGELWSAGDGLLKPLVQKVSRNDTRVRYMGQLGGEELAALYHETDVLVLPSRYEVWGLVINEALAQGLPVLVSNQVGAVDDLIEDGVNGVIVPAYSAESIARGMEQLGSVFSP
jgi:glycosyltransferase involved in cell wall biosynthesis